MVGLDTNVIVRYLAQDEPLQSAKATRLFARLSEMNPGFVSVVAMAETAWVLERSYGLQAAEIATALEAMLASDALVFECEQQVFAATIVLKEGRGSFADALIASLGANAGCTTTHTFDRRAARLEGFELL